MAENGSLSSLLSLCMILAKKLPEVKTCVAALQGYHSWTRLSSWDFCFPCRMPLLECLSRRPEMSKGLKLMRRPLSGHKIGGVCSLEWLIFLHPLMLFYSARGRDRRGRQRTCGVTFLAACWCSVLGGLVPRLDSQAWMSGEFAQEVKVSLLSST